MNRMGNFEYVSAPTTERAIELLGTEKDRAKLLAGGTDLLDELKEGIARPERVINLKGIPGLRGIRFDPTQGLELGALTVLSDVAQHRAVVEHYPALLAALRVLASPQIRNMATVGGNLCQRPRCWFYRDAGLVCLRKGGDLCYAASGENTYHAILGGDGCFMVHPSDLAPALIAYEARVTFAGSSGGKTVPLDEFFIGPGVDITRENVLEPNEVVERAVLPSPGTGSRGVYLKVRDRAAFDFATVSVAAVLEMEGRRCLRARVVLGGVAPTPWAARECDRILSGRSINPRTAERAAEAALQGAEPLSGNAYKVPLAKRLVRRAVLTAAGVSDQAA